MSEKLSQRRCCSGTDHLSFCPALLVTSRYRSQLEIMSGDYHDTMWSEHAGLAHVETLPDRSWALDTSPCRSLTLSVQLFDWRVRNFALNTLSFYLSE